MKAKKQSKSKVMSAEKSQVQFDEKLMKGRAAASAARAGKR